MKAILVIDMPNNCYDCQYCRFDARRYNFRGCVLADTDVQDGTIDICKEVHSCCPLKPMPQKKEVEVNRIEDIMHTEYSIEDIFTNKYIATIRLATDKLISLGWNACLEEIEK